jgi:pimeloyl-ACP methyl ester carboxylesterase
VIEPFVAGPRICTISATVNTTDSANPALMTLAPRGQVRGVALLAHGGRSHSTASGSPLQTPALRMYPFLLDLHRAGRGDGLVACQLRYRLRGYNDGDPVHDVEWALAQIADRHGEVPVCLVGHSMGGRAVLRAAGAEQVRAVAALAPWLPDGEPTEQLADRTIVIAHGARDRVTSPARSLNYALAAHAASGRLCRFEVARSGHAMLERFATWQRLVRRVVLPSVGIGSWDEALAEAFSLPAAAACRVAL